MNAETEAKTNFSTPSKWEKKGFAYSIKTIQKAARTIMNLKIPCTYKSCLLKHNLAGFIEPTVLAKLGYKTQDQCRLCHEENINYTHIIFDCTIEEFLRNQTELHFQLIHKSKPKISIHTVNIFSSEHKLKNEQQKEDYLHIISVFKVTLHKMYHKDINIVDYTDEKKVLYHYNDVLQSAHFTNKNMKKFHKTKARHNSGKNSPSKYS